MDGSACGANHVAAALLKWRSKILNKSKSMSTSIGK